METIKIKDRKLTSKPRVLREKGFVPGTLYGPNLKNKPIKLHSLDLRNIVGNKGEVYKVMNKSGPTFVKFDEIQTNPISGEFIHFSLVELPKGKKNEVDIPVDFQGTPIGVKKGGVFVIMKDEVTINGKPRAIPKSLEADVTNLDIGDKLTIDDLDTPKQINISDGESEIVAVCKPPAIEVPIVNEETSNVIEADDKDSLTFANTAV